MNVETLQSAIFEAERFLSRAKDLQSQIKKGHAALESGYFYAPKEQGAVKRASMDLTRALASLRKPG